MSGKEGPSRARRSDAKANDRQIRRAALQLLDLGRNPTMAEIAEQATVSRQTLYAHFPSRDVLYRALAAQLAELATTAMREPLPSDPSDAIAVWIERAWTLLAEHRALFNPALAEAFATIGSDGTSVHEPVVAGLRRALEALHGRRSGRDEQLSLDWTVAAILALGHEAAAQVAHGQMDLRRARQHFTESALRLALPH